MESIDSAAPDLVRVELHRTPVETEPVRFEFSARDRRSLSALLDGCSWKRPRERTRIWVGDPLLEVPRERWSRVRPRAGTRVLVVGIPADPTGGVLTAFFVALANAAVSSASVGLVSGAIAAPAFVSGAAGFAAAAGTLVGGALGTAALLAGTQALASSLMDAPNQDLGTIGGGQPSPTLSGNANTARRDDPFPCVLGDVRFLPPLGALPYSVVRGTESEAMYLFLVGPGPVKIDPADIKIGDIELKSFGGTFAIREGRPGDGPLTIYTDRVFQAQLPNTFEPIFSDVPQGIGPWVQEPVPGVGHTRIGFDLNFVQGLSRITKSGKVAVYQVGFQCQYRQNAGAWIDVSTLPSFGPLGDDLQGDPHHSVERGGLDVLKFGHADGSTPVTRPFQIGFEFDVVPSGPDAAYEYRMRRVETLDASNLLGGGGSLQIAGTVHWFSLKGFNFDSPPLVEPEIATIELRLPVSKQFQSADQHFSVRARREARIYDPSAVGGADADGWSLQTFETSNPAALLRYVLQGRANVSPFADSKIDIESLTDWYLFCRDFNTAGSGPLRFDLYVDFESNIDDIGKTIAAAGLGRFGQDAQSRFAVTFDAQKTTPVALVTAANARGFNQDFTGWRPLHGLRCKYVNRDQGFDPDAQLLVYDDGYSEANADPKAVQEVRFPGVTTSKLVYVHARRRIAEKSLRRRLVMMEMDLEHLAFSVGDLVDVSHPGLLVGSAWGTVLSTSSARYRDTLEEDFAPYAPLQRVSVDADVQFNNRDVTPTHGVGVAKLTSLNTNAAIWYQPFETSKPQNWASLRFRVDVWPVSAAALSSTDGLRMRLYGPTLSDFKEWRRGTGAGLAAGVFATANVNISTDTADATGGTFDPTRVIRAEMRTNVVSALAGRVWYFDNLRIDSSTSQVCEVVMDQLLELRAGISYSTDHRRIAGAPPTPLGIARLPVRSLDSFGITSDRVVPQFFLFTPLTGGTTEPVAGDLLAFGDGHALSARMLVQEKTPGPLGTATVTFVDEGTGVYTSADVIPDIDLPSSLDVPLNTLGPGKPQVIQVNADEFALRRTNDGSLLPAIEITLRPSPEASRPITRGWSVKYRKRGASAYTALPSVESSRTVRIEDVEEGATYDVVYQALDAVGRASEPGTLQVLVTGKTNPPPDVVNLRLEGELLQWDLLDRPPDLAGYEIRRGPVGGGTFDSATSLTGTTVWPAPPFSFTGLDPGVFRVYVASKDIAGNLSRNPPFIDGFVGSLPLRNVVDIVSLRPFSVVDTEAPVLSGFEDAFAKDVPDTILALENHPEIASFWGTTTDLTIVSSQTPGAMILEGNRSLRLTDNNGDGFLAKCSFAAPQDRRESRFRLLFYGNKAGLWSFGLKFISASDANRWSRYDLTSIPGLSPQTLRVDLRASPTAVGSGGALIQSGVGAIEFTATAPSATTGDVLFLDSFVWSGGAINSVEIDESTGDILTRESGDFMFSEDESAPMFSTDPTAPMFSETGAFLSGFFDTTFVMDAALAPADIRVQFNEEGEAAVSSVSIQVLYRRQNNLIFGTSGDTQIFGEDDSAIILREPSDYVPFPGVIEGVGREPIDLRFVVPGGNVQGRITSMNVVVDVEDEEETINDVVIPATGEYRIPLVKSYRSISVVNPILMMDGNGAQSVLIVDREASGPSVIAVNKDGDRVQALADFQIRGAKRG